MPHTESSMFSRHYHFQSIKAENMLGNLFNLISKGASFFPDNDDCQDITISGFAFMTVVSVAGIP